MLGLHSVYQISRKEEKLPPFISCNKDYKKAQGLKFWGEGEGCGLALTMFTKGT